MMLKLSVRRRQVLALGSVVALSPWLAACGEDARSKLPELPFTQLDGSRHQLADLKGRVTLVNFWATSCSTCVKEMPELVATHQRFKDRGLETLAVAMEYDPPAYVTQFVQSRKLPFRVAIDHDGRLAAGFGPVQFTPTTFVVNRRGEIVKRYVGEPDFSALHQLIDKMLAEPVA